MRVLHICTWYPDIEKPHRALFIKRQIDSLEDHCKNDIVHFEVIKGSFFGLQKKHDNNLKEIIIKLPFISWKLNELIYFVWLYSFLLIQKKHEKYDLINFHIAYPVLTYWHRIKSKIKIPVLITEHWSAYHLNFGVKHQLPRIQRIFKQKIPLITVSHALYKDIEKFSEAESKYYIVPNIVDSEVFYPSNELKKDIFLMVGTWKKPKLPLLAMEAFLNFQASNPNYRLIVIGKGPMFGEMQNWIKRKNIGDEIRLAGVKTPNEIANIMRSAKALLHPSGYETFSVVCAEARASALPILASKRGGISEAVGEHGILIENKLKYWDTGIKQIIEFIPESKDNNPFDLKSIGKKYYKALLEVKDETES